MITYLRSSLTEMRSSRKESTFLAEMPLIKLVGAANCQSPPNTLKQGLCTTGTPRLGCVLTNAIRPFDLRTRRTTSTRFDLKFLGLFSQKIDTLESFIVLLIHRKVGTVNLYKKKVKPSLNRKMTKLLTFNNSILPLRHSC